jgi:hypothetical protein
MKQKPAPDSVLQQSGQGAPHAGPSPGRPQ